MNKMAVMPIYRKKHSKIFFSGTGGSISTKLCMKYRWLKYYNVYINHDTVMTLSYFTARSTWVANKFEWEKKTFKMSYKVKILQEMFSMTEY